MLVGLVYDVTYVYDDVTYVYKEHEMLVGLVYGGDFQLFSVVRYIL